MNKHLPVLIVLLGFGLVGCASGVLQQFPINDYSDDTSAVELHFACESDTCIAGLYLDNKQVLEGFGDYRAFRGGLEPKTKYIVKVPPSKYLVGTNGKNYLDEYNRFIQVSDRTCITYNEVTIGINIFAPSKNGEGSWVDIDCKEYDLITNEFDLVNIN